MMCWQIQSVEERKLLDEFDKDLHINPEGGFKATPPYGIDSVYPQQQRHLYKVVVERSLLTLFVDTKGQVS